MSIIVDWDQGSSQQIIHVQFQGEWSQEEYQRAAQQSADLMQETARRVTVVLDMSETLSNATSKDSFDSWLTAVNLWKAQPNYAGFWIVVKPNYWTRMVIWALSRLYNPTRVEVVSTVGEARQIALERFKG